MRHMTIARDDVALHAQIDGDDRPDAPTLVFANSLGTTLHMWDGILPYLPDGLGSIADVTMQRWFSRDFLMRPELADWRQMLIDTSPVGYAGVCAAIAGTDFYTPTSGLRIPTLGIAGSEDGATPPDLVRETVDLIPGSQFQLMRRTGHLPCVEAPEAYAKILIDFIAATGHMNG